MSWIYSEGILFQVKLLCLHEAVQIEDWTPARRRNLLLNQMEVWRLDYPT